MNTIQYKQKEIIGDYSILVYNHPFNDIFNFYIINDTDNTFILKTIRLDGAWGLDLKVRLIDNLTDDYIDVNIGSNHSNSKDVSLGSFIKQKLPENAFYVDTIKQEKLNVNKLIINIIIVIHTSNNPISGSNTRSFYSHKERYEQLINQIKKHEKKYQMQL